MGVGGTFNENKTSDLHNSEVLKEKKKIKNPSYVTRKLYLVGFPSYVTRFFYFRFLNLKFPSCGKLAMRS